MRISSSSLVLFLAVAACTGSGSTQNPQAPKQDPATPPTGGKPAASKTTFKIELVAGQPGAEVRGTVRDVNTKELLPGVTIVLTSPALQGTQTAITDETGSFSMTSLPPGAYEVTAYYNDVSITGKLAVETGKVSKVTLDWDIRESPGEIIKIGEAPREPEFKSAAEALHHGALAQAYKLGTAEVAKAPSSTTQAILAIARYGDAVEALRFEAFTGRGENKRTGKDFKLAMSNLLAALDATQEHLAIAAKDPKFSLELCVACMATEDGFLNSFPPGSFDIERDRTGKELDPDDKGRRPTYHFDHGDITWARAMVSFQQAFVNATLSYDWDWIDALMADVDDGAQAPKKITIRILEPARIAKAKDLILAGLTASDECRAEFLAETDDDREWVPNPKQKNYASPLTVDDKLFKTWAEIIGDVRSLVSGQNGLSIKAMWSALGEKSAAPAGFIDPAAMLTAPKDIVIDLGAFDRIENEKNVTKRNEQIVALLKAVVGNGYKPTMKASRLTDRLLQLRKDMAGSENALENKLKYMLWLN